MVQWYHASAKRFHVGDMLTNVVCNGYAGSYVYLTSSPIPHYTIVDKAIEWNHFVYEVEPLGKLRYGKNYDEAMCLQARVVRCVGSARGILRTHTPTNAKHAVDHLLTPPKSKADNFSLEEIVKEVRASVEEERILKRQIQSKVVPHEVSRHNKGGGRDLRTPQRTLRSHRKARVGGAHGSGPRLSREQKEALRQTKREAEQPTKVCSDCGMPLSEDEQGYVRCAPCRQAWRERCAALVTCDFCHKEVRRDAAKYLLIKASQPRKCVCWECSWKGLREKWEMQEDVVFDYKFR